jgi:hypothetical protein
MIEKIEQYSKLKKELYEQGVLSVHGPDVHVTDETLLELSGGIENLTVKERRGNEYPWEVSFREGDYKYYTILRSEQFETLGKQLLVQHLESQLLKLKEGVVTI